MGSPPRAEYGVVDLTDADESMSPGAAPANQCLDEAEADDDEEEFNRALDLEAEAMIAMGVAAEGAVAMDTAE